MKTHIPNRLKPLVFATVLAFAGSASAATFTVTNTSGGGPGSLSFALIQAGTCPGSPHTVDFNIPGTGPHVISPGGTLSLGTCTGTILNGYTQPGASPNTIADPSQGSNAVIRIVIDASLITGGGAISLGGTGQQVRGINVQRLTSPGPVFFSAGPTSVIGGNFIGTDVTGNNCAGAGMFNGIQIGGGGTVGGPAAADRNVIGCSSTYGIQMFNATVKGNLIGIGGGGANIGNLAEGVVVGPNSFPPNIVGGTVLGEGNTIAFNNAGVRVFFNSSSTISGNDIFMNNLIGIDLPGPNANPNAASPPVINAAGVTYNSGSTTISGTFPNRSGVSVDFFQNLTGGLDQGQEYVTTVTGFNGTAFSATIPSVVRNPTVTYTVSGETSMFSAPYTTPESNVVPPNFPPTAVGSSSPPQALIIGNPTAANLTFTLTNSNSLEFKDSTGGPPPNVAHYCGIGSDAAGAPLGGVGTVPGGGGCTMNLIFSPTTVGARTGALTLSSNAPQNPQVISLAGAGVAAAAPALSIAPPSPVDFGNVTINSTAGPRTLMLTNSGTADLLFAPFTLSGDYSQTSTCPLAPTPLAPTTTCTVFLSFTPTVAGARPGTLTIASNAPSTPDLVTLTGTGTAAAVPVVSLVPTSLAFGGQLVGTTSAAQPATLTNTGTATLNISSITPLGDFAHTTTCGGASLLPNGSCSFSVTFTPLVVGARTGSISIADNASGSPHVLSLTGTGTIAPVATISVVPPAVTFPPTQVGVVSAEQTVTVSNTGGGALTISAVQVVGAEFTVSFTDCTSGALGTGGSCVVKVVFAPAGTGSRAATLRIISNALTSPTQVTLTGTGTAAPSGTLDAQPPTLTFVDQVAGTTSASQSVAVTNTGVFPVTVASVSVSGDFTQTNNCTVVAPGAGCTVVLVFAPQGLGTRNGVLTIVSDASNPALSVSLLGNGVLTSFPVIELSATSLGYGNRVMGVGSSAQAVTVRNAGGANLVIARIYTQGDFRQSNDCTAALAPGATCRIDVGFVPSIPGTRGGKLFVESNATSAPKTVDLSGTGCRFFTLPGSRIGSLICL